MLWRLGLLILVAGLILVAYCHSGRVKRGTPSLPALTSPEAPSTFDPWSGRSVECQSNVHVGTCSRCF
jgi:hypothetical protein